MRSSITALGKIEVLTPEGQRVTMASLWSEDPTVAVWLRHFGCLFCLEQTAVLVAALPRIEAAGGRLLLIGSGSPEQALRFQQMKAPGATVATDPDRLTYRALGARRSMLDMLGRGVLSSWRNARRLKVHSEGLQGDGLQLGAALVVDPPNRVLLTHINSSLGDHPPVDALIAALVRAQRVPTAALGGARV